MAGFRRFWRWRRGAIALRLAAAVAAVLGVLAAGYWSSDVIAEDDASVASYARVSEQLSQAIASCRELARQLAPYDAVFRRNPMTPLVGTDGQMTSSVGLHDGLAVQGIIWSEQRPLVIVDDELYAEGAVVGPYRIKQIRPYRILVERDGQEQFVPLNRLPAATSAAQ